MAGLPNKIPKSHTWHVKLTMFPTEEHLRQSFIAEACPSLWTTWTDSHVATVQESTCSNGRADWVWSAYRSPHEPFAENANLLQQPTCSRILAMLKGDSPRRHDYLEVSSGVSSAVFRRSLLQLIAADLVLEAGNRRYVLGPSFRVPPIEICSFEFKLNDWRRALYQAKRYRSFSHRVYVVAPPSTVNRMTTSQDTFRRFGIGIIAHGLEGISKRVLACRKRAPISRHNFIQAVGMLIHQPAVQPVRV
jgi:hypothetical protein